MTIDLSVTWPSWSPLCGNGTNARHDKNWNILSRKVFKYFVFIRLVKVSTIFIFYTFVWKNIQNWKYAFKCEVPVFRHIDLRLPGDWSKAVTYEGLFHIAFSVSTGDLFSNEWNLNADLYWLKKCESSIK